jgi:hypothetical protein
MLRQKCSALHWARTGTDNQSWLHQQRVTPESYFDFTSPSTLRHTARGGLRPTPLAKHPPKLEPGGRGKRRLTRNDINGPQEIIPSSNPSTCFSLFLFPCFIQHSPFAHRRP